MAAERNIQQDHPRLCGEKSPYLAQAPITEGSPPPMRGKVNSQMAGGQSLLGSPPPMRGKDEFHMKNDDELRITPAYAGKSC